VNALGASILVSILVVVVFGSRRLAVLGMMAGILYLTQSQRVEVAGFNLYAVRFVELAGFIRVMARREFSRNDLTGIDRALIVTYLYTVGVFLLRSSEDHAYTIGIAVDAFLTYFAFRGLIDSVARLKWFLGAFVVMLIPYVLLVVIETITFSNPFGIVGGFQMAFGGETWFRNGRLRAVGSFGHPSLMGTLGGTFLPIYMALWFSEKQRFTAFAGTCLCLAVVWASNSGGPLSCAAFSFVGWMFWSMRKNMNWVRRGMAFTLLILALAMNAPIWYLLARIGSVTGGDSWHRAQLLDVATQQIGRWWLAGMPTSGTRDWLPYTNTVTGVADMTNHFLVFGITAGLGAIVLMLVLQKKAFSELGKALIAIRAAASPEKGLEHLYWGLGVVMTVHIANWFSITYWDQINLVWFMHMAVVSGLTAEALRMKTEEAAPVTAPAISPRRRVAMSPVPGTAMRRSTSWSNR
jgi:hypothetical protein